ncbi:MAG TPA: MFS transporter [Dehalococcoidales bacterium]|nr:MFS transporter [Dehalococcoidales bacterium]
MFEPKAALTNKETAHGLRMLTLEGMTSAGFTSITTSGLLAAFALALGANNMQIGILAAIPFLMQLLQIPAILLVERLRRRKAIAVTTWFVAQLFWFPMALIPFFFEVPSAAAISALLVLLAIRGVFSAVTNCSWNSWIRDLVPQAILGRFFSRRLALSTAMAAVYGLAAAFFVDYWRGQAGEESSIMGYTYVLLFGAFFIGMASPIFMARMPEPVMPKATGEQPSLWTTLITPLRDRNFRQLLKFLLTWSFALNMAVPFFAVYMLQRLGLPLSWVIGLSVLSQFFNILFLRVWGPLADRFGSKVILSLCASLYLLVILGWAFSTMPDRNFLTIPLLIILHIFAGIAAAGVTLTIGTIGFKLAPQAQSAPYLAGASLATNLGAGLGPLLGGLLAHFFSTSKLALDFNWIDANRAVNLGVIQLTGIDFIFILTFVIGLFTLNILAALREEGEAGKDVVLKELQAQTRSALQSVNSVSGANFINIFPASFLSRVPGMDVAIGVTAYQLADTAKTVTEAAMQGHKTMLKVARAIQNELTQLWKNGVAPPEHDTEVARHAIRGALQAGGRTPSEIERLISPAMVGIVGALKKAQVSPYDALRGAAYGVVQSASETGMDLARSAAEAMTGARDTARKLKLDEQQSTREAARGALEAAQDLGSKAVAQVKAVLPVNFSDESSISQEEKDDPTASGGKAG